MEETEAAAHRVVEDKAALCSGRRGVEEQLRSLALAAVRERRGRKTTGRVLLPLTCGPRRAAAQKRGGGGRAARAVAAGQAGRAGSNGKKKEGEGEG